MMAPTTGPQGGYSLGCSSTVVEVLLIVALLAVIMGVCLFASGVGGAWLERFIQTLGGG